MYTELENKFLTSRKDEIISFFNDNQDCLTEVIDLALSDKKPFSFRAVMLLNNITKKNDSRIKKYIPKLFKKTEQQKGGHQRELIRLLSKMNLSESIEGKLFDICMSVWENINNTPSERYIALQFIMKCIKKYPELAGEIEFLLNEQYIETLTPGAKKSVMKIKNNLGFD